MNKPVYEYERVSMISPKGIARFPRLAEPSTKFKAEGVYEVGLVLDPDLPDHAAYLDSLDKMLQQHVACVEAKNKGVKGFKIKEVYPIHAAETDRDGNETGKRVVKFTLAASWTDKNTGQTKEQRPMLIDSKLRPMANRNIGGGSEIIVKGDFTPFFNAKKEAGLSRRIRVVQVVKRVESGQSFGDMGFEAVDDGYDSHADVVESMDPKDGKPSGDTTRDPAKY